MMLVLAMLTNRCNLQCKLCNIWQEKKSTLNIQRLYKVLLEIISNDLKVSCLGITGGEPFLEEKNLQSVFKIIEPKLIKGDIFHFNITTNGSFPLRILKFIDKIPKDCINKLSFNVSLDGLEETHNYLRGKEVFKKVIISLDILKKFRIDTTINFVINPFNSAQIFNIYKLSSKLGFDFELEIFNPNVPAYYHYLNRIKIQNNNKNWRQVAVKEIESVLLQKEVNFNKKQLIVLSNYLKTGDWNEVLIKNCKIPSSLLFIRATGELYSCPHEPPLGKIEDFNYQKFLNRQKNLSLKIKNEGCRKCLSTMGSLSYVK